MGLQSITELTNDIDRARKLINEAQRFQVAVAVLPWCMEQNDGLHGVRDAVRIADNLISELAKPIEPTSAQS